MPRPPAVPQFETAFLPVEYHPKHRPDEAEIHEMNGERRCVMCEEYRPIEQMHKRPDRMWTCFDCEPECTVVGCHGWLNLATRNRFSDTAICQNGHIHQMFDGQWSLVEEN